MERVPAVWDALYDRYGDIDNFKRINDEYGHPAGDDVLRQYALVFTEHMGRKGFVARWGGEEFLFLFERMDAGRAAEYMEELRKLVESQRIVYGVSEIHTTMTFGIADCSGMCNTDSVVKAADHHLYYGKEHGKNQVIVKGIQTTTYEKAPEIFNTL